MTAVMRALRTDRGQMALRVGVVRAGRIVEERVIKEHKTVTIGTSEEATFAAGAAPIRELFARRKDGYVLQLGDASGKVALATEVVTFDDLRARGLREVALTDESRGKVVVGDTTFLFQFVQPPPKGAKPQLPLSVKGGVLSHVDWSLTIIAAISFLLHFGGVGVLYSDWMDVVVDDHRTVAGLVDMMQHIPAPPVTETPTTDAPSDSPAPADKKPTAVTSAPSKSSNSSASHGKSAPHSVDSNQAAVLAAQADAIQLNLLAATNGNSSVQNALSRTEIPPVDLSSQAASNSAISTKSTDLNIHGGSTAIGPSHSGGLALLANDVHESGNDKAGPARTIAAPKVEPQIGALTGGSVSGADRVIASLRGRFRACYQKGLNADSTMSGKVIIATRIQPNGEVQSADVASNAGLSSEVTSCIAGAIKHAQFDQQPGMTTLNVPVSFVHQ